MWEVDHGRLRILSHAKGGLVAMEKVSQLRILVVEDEDPLRVGLEEFLRGLGMEVRSGRDGEEAQRMIAQEKQAFQVVLTDLFLPQSSGLQVLVAARRRDPDTQVVLMTGFGSLESAIDAMNHGAFDYITKPFQFVEFEMILNRIVERRRLIEENRLLSEKVQALYTRLIREEPHKARSIHR
ncbi:MAG: response regulator [Terriglobia bacterium]